MAVATYTKAGAKSTAPAKLDKSVFGVEVKSHQLLKEAYIAYLANGRGANATTKKRGQVSGGGRKPWRQKGTGNARVGSSRTPVWRGGGVVFGPRGNENYTHKLNSAAKRQALRQALSLAAKENRIKVIESISLNDGKTKSARALLNKIEAGTCLLVIANKEEALTRAVRNIPDARLVQAKYLNVYDVMNAESLVFDKAALDVINEWLGEKA